MVGLEHRPEEGRAEEVMWLGLLKLGMDPFCPPAFWRKVDVHIQRRPFCKNVCAR